MHTESPVQGNAPTGDSSPSSCPGGNLSGHRPRRSPAETLLVSKSILAIVGLGIGGCLLLSLMMKQLMQHQAVKQQVASPPVLAAAFGKQLVGPLSVREEHEGGAVRLVVHGRVAAKQDKLALATAIGAEVWKRVGGEMQPSEVKVTLRDADGSAPVTQIVARPAPAR